MTDNWKTKIVALPYWLGEICLFRKSFNLRVTNVDFLNIPSEDPSLLKPYKTEINQDTDGYMLHSVPFDQGRPDFWTEDGYVKYVTKFYNHYYIDLSLTYENYLAGFSSKTRSTLKRKIRKFEKLCNGNIDWRSYATREEMSEFHRIARQISKTTYQEKLLDAGLPENEEFYTEMLESAKSGKVRGYILFKESKPISYLYTPIDNGRFIYAHLGYLPEVSKYSPGIVLQFKVLEYLFDSEEGKIFDFTEGQSDQKKLFSTHHMHCGNLICLNYTATNYCWLQFNRLTNKLSSSLGNLLERLGLKKAIKKYLRK